MEIKVGHVYLCRPAKGLPFYLAKIKEHVGRSSYLATKVKLYDGNISENYLDSNDLVCELDPSVWDKAMKLHNVYITSLTSLIQTNEI